MSELYPHSSNHPSKYFTSFCIDLRQYTGHEINHQLNNFWGIRTHLIPQALFPLLSPLRFHSAINSHLHPCHYRSVLFSLTSSSLSLPGPCDCGVDDAISLSSFWDKVHHLLSLNQPTYERGLLIFLKINGNLPPHLICLWLLFLFYLLIFLLLLFFSLLFFLPPKPGFFIYTTSNSRSTPALFILPFKEPFFFWLIVFSFVWSLHLQNLLVLREALRTNIFLLFIFFRFLFYFFIFKLLLSPWYLFPWRLFLKSRWWTWHNIFFPRRNS